MALCIAGWPISAFTFAKDEPPVILGLSWYAILVGALGNLFVAMVKKDTGSNGSD